MYTYIIYLYRIESIYVFRNTNKLINTYIYICHEFADTRPRHFVRRHT